MRHDQRGALNPNAKLTEVQVRAIRKLHKGGKWLRPHSLSEIATMYGVSKSRVSLICSGKSWRHVS